MQKRATTAHRTQNTEHRTQNTEHTSIYYRLSKFLQISTLVLSFSLVVITWLVGYRTIIKPAVVLAQAAGTSYTENWSALEGLWSELDRFVCCTVRYHTGFPEARSTADSFDYFKAAFAVTKWSVSGNISTSPIPSSYTETWTPDGAIRMQSIMMPACTSSGVFVDCPLSRYVNGLPNNLDVVPRFWVGGAVDGWPTSENIIVTKWKVTGTVGP